MKKEDSYYLKRAIEVSEEAFDKGNDAFGCILVNKDGAIVMEQGNVVFETKDRTAHDAITLIRKASMKYFPEELWDCTLYASVEPCCMCIGAAYWANLGAIKYVVAEKDVMKILPGGIAFHSSDLLACGEKPIKMEGPYKGLENEAIKVLEKWIAKIMS